MRYKNILVTGGAGFIGSAFIRYGLEKLPLLKKIVNLDLLTYAANLESLKPHTQDPRYLFVHGDIQDEALVLDLCKRHDVEAIVHCAAESHVDNSIHNPKAFIDTNIYGTFALLEVVRKLPHIHFHHVSTDEVYGSLRTGFFKETSSYGPNSPYSASKAASDHLVRAWAHTFNLSTTLSHCTNNYGPYQNREKFIPRMILSSLEKKPLAVYGTGENIRDWLYVDDHVEALWTILDKGQKGEVYDIGAKNEKKNIELLKEILLLLSDLLGMDYQELSSLITHVPDRPGHDFRYAIDYKKIQQELGWTPRHSFSSSLRKTIEWYLNNKTVGACL